MGRLAPEPAGTLLSLEVPVFASRYMPCERCGASLERSERPVHECSFERLLDYRMFFLRDEVARFEVWSAARRVRGLPG